MDANYRSPKLTIRSDERSPQEMFPNEFHPSISSASGKWEPCACHDGDWRAHQQGLLDFLRNIVAQQKLAAPVYRKKGV